MLKMLKIFDAISKSSLPRVTQAEIVCGDCGGDAILPIRTHITGDGRCAVCGGRSFVPASTLCEALARHLRLKKTVERLIENEKQYQNRQTSGDYIATE